jgi:hypothetical protein
MLVIRTIQHIKAPNDINGNPRRVYLITEIVPEHTDPLGLQWPREVLTRAYDAGYRGLSGIPGRTGDEYLLPTLNTTPSEYRRLRKQYPER